mmetsp:Transcript_130363/g.237041  ORF Transcript_130363/g.237041 Transcript_130363/m.237041 type:complete len:449 (-) Transcript_130363:70-1416(-)
MAHVTLLRAEDLTWTNGDGTSLIQTGQSLSSHEAKIQAEVARLTSSLHRCSPLVKFMDFAVDPREPSTLIPYLIYGGAFVIMAVCMAALSGQRRREYDEDDHDSDTEKEEVQEGPSEPSHSGEHHIRSCASSIAAPHGLTQAMRWCLGVLVISTWLHLGFRFALEVLHGQFPMPYGFSCQMCDAICYSLAFAVEVAKSEFGSYFRRRHLAARLDIVAGGLSVAVAFLGAVHSMAAVAERLSRKGHPGGFGRHGKGAETNFVHAGSALLVCIGFRQAMDVALLAMCHCYWPVSRTMFCLPTWLLSWEVASEGVSLGFWVPRRKLEASKTSGDLQKDVSSWGQLRFLRLLGCSESTLGCASSKVPIHSMATTSAEENFNMSGVLLHLLCGTFRGSVVLISGFLVWLGVLTDAARADAVCALLVGVFVTGVVLVFLRKLLMTLACPWPRTS